MAHLCRLLTRRAIPMYRALGTSAVNRGEAVAHSGDSSVDHPKVEDKRAIIGTCLYLFNYSNPEFILGIFKKCRNLQF